ncbi:MAG: DUF1449 family protein [Puniceicoccaceae bacterium]|nr:MAG: DUF1449 family protein [Puniceicoccaceae bacterium]
MVEFLLSPANWPFTGALVVVAVIGLLQVLGLVAGLDLAEGADELLPDFDAPSTAGLEGVPAHFAMLGWLELGRVPVLFSLVAFLTLFAVIGLNGQALLALSGLGPLPALLAAPPVFLICLVPLKWTNRLLAKVMPRSESMAVSKETFLGRIAVIVVGEATHERPAEARLTGPLGRTHYVMVYADEPEVRLASGAEVLLVGRRGEHFTAISNPNPNLSPHSARHGS